jgi:hypothetical protein
LFGGRAYMRDASDTSPRLFGGTFCGPHTHLPALRLRGAFLASLFLPCGGPPGRPSLLGRPLAPRFLNALFNLIRALEVLSIVEKLQVRHPLLVLTVARLNR